MVEHQLTLISHLQFIIEGLITIFCTLLTLFFLPDYPSSAKFLTEDDKKFIEARIKVKGGGDPVQPKDARALSGLHLQLRASGIVDVLHADDRERAGILVHQSSAHDW
jgi:hypothetical protein